MLRRIFGSGTDEVSGRWRKLHNEEFNYLYSSPNIVGGQVENIEKGSANSMYREEVYTGF